MLTIRTVLHPGHKLKYFQRAGWPSAWSKTAHNLVRTEYDTSYATRGDDAAYEPADDDSGAAKDAPAHDDPFAGIPEVRNVSLTTAFNADLCAI